MLFQERNLSHSCNIFCFSLTTGEFETEILLARTVILDGFIIPSVLGARREEPAMGLCQRARKRASHQGATRACTEEFTYSHDPAWWYNSVSGYTRTDQNMKPSSKPTRPSPQQRSKHHNSPGSDSQLSPANPLFDSSQTSNGANHRSLQPQDTIRQAKLSQKPASCRKGTPCGCAADGSGRPGQPRMPEETQCSGIMTIATTCVAQNLESCARVHMDSRLFSTHALACLASES